VFRVILFVVSEEGRRTGNKDEYKSQQEDNIKRRYKNGNGLREARDPKLRQT
jgi:hypothetical protein